MYTHIHTTTGRECKIIKWGLPNSTVRSPSLYDQGEDEYQAMTTQLELVVPPQNLSEQLETAWEKAFSGCRYGEEETRDAKYWFTAGFLAAEGT